MAEIMEVFEDIKKATGDKGFYILIGVAVLFGLYSFTKGTGEEETVSVSVAPTYPDVDRNADVVIDSIQDSIEYSEGVILDAIENQESTIQDIVLKPITDNFKATNDYIQKAESSLRKELQAIDTQGSTVTIQAGKQTGKGMKKKATYTYTKKAGYNTDTSIVDALKVAGVNPTFKKRSLIAEFNGIVSKASDYTGSAEQNTQMLGMLKAGKLEKV